MARVFSILFRALSLPAVFLFAASLAAQSSKIQIASDEKVVGGPYVVNAAPKSATVMWVVQIRAGFTRYRFGKVG